MKWSGTAEWKIGIAVAVLAMLSLPLGSQQTAPASPQAASAKKREKPPSSALLDRTRQILIANAKALESRGRPDMAIQVWQQVLLSDPNNPQALAGLARDLKLSGSSQEAQAALERLRKAQPNNPEIGKIQGMTPMHVQNSRLQQAGDLASAGKNQDAMRIYRELYGDHPPDGDIGLAYYETLYGTPTGKQQAIDGMRAMAQRNPGDPRYAIALGRMLSYDPRTRAEGINLLRAHAQDPDARDALRQALLWDSSNPHIADELKQYLKLNPSDALIAARLKEDEAKLAQMNSGIARTPAEQAAFAALNRHQLELAQQRFMAILDKNPNNPRAAAGMGFLRMQQKNFAGAVSYLTQAQQNGFRSAVVESALKTSRFWFTMNEASQALDGNQFELAGAKYQEALAMRPRSVEALSGLAGLMTKQQQYGSAAQYYEQILKLQPRSTDAWRGLFLSYARNGESQRALGLADRMPATVRQELNRDPDYLRTLATVNQTLGRPTDAQRALSQALALPFPDNGANLKADTRLQYASILMEARRYDQAAAMYDQILRDDPTNVSAWMGLVSAHHQLNLDSAAINDVERMPPATYESALTDPGFLSMLAAVYQQANQYDIAQNLLERSIKLQQARGVQPSVQTQLQLAAIYLQRDNTVQAYAIYRNVLTAHPGQIDAWKGLISDLQANNHSQEALQQLAYVPASVRQRLEADPEFQQTLAGIYAATGDNARATQYMLKVQQHYAALHQPLPPSVAIQNAWLLYNTKNDRALYPALMQLGGRADLTPTQRETVQEIWANWAVQRAGAAMDNNDNERALDILESAANAFPDNLQVRKVLAGGYLKVGQTKDALAIYKNIPMDNATALDMQGAIGAALAANDRTQAEIWLRQALQKYPNNPGILGMAARYEQARGDRQRAADYWRAALAAMPPGSPANRLAHDLDYPETSTRTRKVVTANDLQRLLNPGNEPFAKVAQLPPLPSYGPDPYLGTAPVPVVIPQQAVAQQLPQQPPMLTAPATTTIQVPLAAATPPAASAAPQGSAPAVETSLPPGTNAAPAKAKKSRRRRHASSTDYTGQMQLTPAEENVTTTGPVQPAQPQSAPEPMAPVFIPTLQDQPAQSAPQTTPAPSTEPNANTAPPVLVPAPQSSVTYPDGTVHPALQLSPEPMDARAAQTQAMFAAQTDGQLTQGSAAQMRALGNAPIQLPSEPSAPQQTDMAMAQPPAYTGVQYTPSAQEAASGAYSAQKQPLPGNNPTQQSAAPGRPNQPAQSAAPEKKKKPSKAERRRATKTERVPTLVTAPSEQLPPPQQQPAYQYPAPQTEQQAAGEAQTPGISDQQLQEQNLPPLRGPWIKVRRQAQPLSPREEAEQQLQSLESSYSGWLGGAGLIDFRGGNLGYDRLAALQAPFEASAPLGYGGRITLVVKPVFLDSGQANGTAITQVQESTTAGTTLVTIPTPLGTDTNTGPNATAGTTGTPPPQQNAAGIGGELQLAFPHFAIAGGYTPYGFLVSNWTARLQWRPANGPFTFSFLRDSIKDSQLSYGGLRDPGTASLSYPGAIWGGVIANQGNFQFSRGDAQSGFYLGGGGQYITGYQVETNSRIDGSGGAYWRVKTVPEYGNLSVGANFFGMHYAHNENALTYGMGGYFSPQFYLLANIPFTWEGHYLTHLHYEILGGIGIQAFQQDLTPLFPLATQAATEIALNNAALPALTSVGANYNVRGSVAYQISPHWFAGGFLTGNNSRNYNEVSAGFSIHYMFRSQPSTVTTPTGLFPSDGLRPFSVP